MNALSNLIQADTLRFAFIDLELVGPEAADPGPRHNVDRCVAKAPGELRFSLNSASDLDLSRPKLIIPLGEGEGESVDAVAIDIEFVATQTQVLSDGSALVTWSVDQLVDRDFAQEDDVTLHIDRIEGSLTTLVHVLSSWKAEKTCSGAPRSAAVELNTHPGPNRLVIRGRASKGSISVDAMLAVENIALQALGLEDYTVKPRISTHRDECGIGVKAGGVASFSASVNLHPAGGVPAYQWTVNGGGAAIVGSSTAKMVKVQLGPTGQPIDVTVDVTLLGLHGATTLRYWPETADTLRAKTLMCDMRRLLHVNLLVDPLWDPLRDYVARPPTRAELRRIHEFGAQLSRQAELLS